MTPDQLRRGGFVADRIATLRSLRAALFPEEQEVHMEGMTVRIGRPLAPPPSISIQRGIVGDAFFDEMRVQLDRHYRDLLVAAQVEFDQI